jgi:transcriptional regulator with XRE-family HTH domain
MVAPLSADTIQWLVNGGLGAINEPNRVSQVTADPERFGRLVESRRRELGLSHRDVSEAGGPTTVTFSKIERGRTPKPGLKTFAKLDKALRWKPGSAVRTFEGADPEPLEGAKRRRTPTLGDRPILATEDAVTLRTDVVAELIDAATQMDPIVARIGDGQLSEADRRIQLIVDRIFRAWIIAQAESWRVAGDLRRNEILITRMLGDYLAREPETADGADAEDLAYLRWLLGRGDEPQPDRMAIFQRRLDERAT